MDKSDELLERCFKCKSYQENDCGIYFMMALWQKECKFFKEAPIKRAIEREIREYPLRARKTKNT